MPRKPVKHPKATSSTKVLSSITSIDGPKLPKALKALDDAEGITVNRKSYQKKSRGRPSVPAPKNLPEPLSENDELRLHDQTLLDVGSAIREARMARNLTMEMVYGTAGLERASYGRIELGKKGVTVFTIRKIARAMGMTMAQLLDGIR